MDTACSLGALSESCGPSPGLRQCYLCGHWLCLLGIREEWPGFGGSTNQTAYRLWSEPCSHGLSSPGCYGELRAAESPRPACPPKPLLQSRKDPSPGEAARPGLHVGIQRPQIIPRNKMILPLVSKGSKTKVWQKLGENKQKTAKPNEASQGTASKARPRRKHKTRVQV